MQLTTWLARSVVLTGVFLFQITSQAANLIDNGEFEDGYFPWEPPGWWAGGNGTYGVDGQGRFCTTITALGTANWGAQLRQQGISFTEGNTYDVSLKAWSSVPVNIEMSAADESSGFVWIFGSRLDINAPLDGPPQEISLSFTAGADTDVGIFRFLLGGGDVPLNETVCFDDIVVDAPAVNLLANSTFEDGVLLPPGEIGFYEGSAGSAGVDAEGRYCIVVDNPGPNPWSLQYRENDITYVNGRSYEFSADVWSSAPVSMEISGVDENGGFTWIFGSNFSVDAPLDGQAQHLSTSFTAAADTETGKFRFLMGNGHVPAGTTVCLDNLALLDPEGAEEPEVPPPPPVHVNQLGYLPFADKRATYALPEGVTDVETPRSWLLMQGDVVITSGMTIPHGIEIDQASGDLVHTVDFSSVTTEGTEYTLVVNEAEESFTSESFTIGADIYSQLKYDALAYFYHNRSGTPILAEVVGETWARPAGHLSDSVVETLACLDGSEGCVTVDASGGWYDAGDHGKYVVNGGISVWTLLNQYERAKHLGSNLGNFGDGTMQLPVEETANDVSDLLDEARWEIEWFFKMQVPHDQPLAGMVYHKMHDENWTGLPMAPHEDPQTRYVHPPSTAATLNFAAVGGQCFRAYKHVDHRFAFECLLRAIGAYHAAKTHPIMMASGAGNGGGTYNDFDVTDEFYWAATELYLATGLPYYAKEMRESPLHLTVPIDDISLMTWQKTNALGMLSMVTVGDRPFINKRWVKEARAAVLEAADKYASSVVSEGYALPMSEERYPWGSNSFVVNNLIVLGLAHDISCDSKYADAMLEGVDYLFGRNPMGHSYVTGYGSRVEQNPHHRFWANALDPSYPSPPPGVMSGGPNSNLEDPVAQALLQGCAPQRCFVDDINAWSVNEITINWNAPFAWVTAYLDELANEDAGGSCRAKEPPHKHGQHKLFHMPKKLEH